MHWLENKVFDVIDARCNHGVQSLLLSLDLQREPCFEPLSLFLLLKGIFIRAVHLL